MAGGVFVANDSTKQYDGTLTVPVIITCIVAASGGLIFGYDIGISGGVTSMESFLRRFFPKILRKMEDSKRDQYCVYDSQVLTSFTSSLYIAGLVTSLMASRVTKAIGRQAVMLLGGATFFIGAIINAAAINVVMLILGRMFLGFGVGFTNQATPVYLAEMAPPRWRGAFNAGFQLFIGIGVLAANLTNYATAQFSWGWRLSLGLAGVPALVILLGALLVPDTPSSLVYRGKLDRARSILHRVRGPDIDVEVELKDIVRSIETSRAREAGKKGAFRRMLQRRYRPYLVMAVAIPMFQQLTGVVVVAFFSPLLFQTVGFKNDGPLICAVILGAVNLASIVVSTFVVDRYGRKVLFMQGGAQMILCQVAVACILGAKIGTNGGAALPQSYALAVLVLTCTFVAGFGWSWGPLSWLVPSEIFPVEVRSAGQSICVAVNFSATFAQTQGFLAMLCRFKYGIFLFYAGWVAAMTAFIALLLPETRGIPLESMHVVWERHWFWRRFFNEDENTACLSGCKQALDPR